MSESLDKLIEQARNHKWTEAERRQQVISFAYGNLKLADCDVTLEGVAAEYDKLHEEN